MRPGDVLANRYELIDLLDESGGASFWRARDRVLARHVAIHVLAPDDPRARPLVAAAKSSAAVVDRHLLRVLDAALTDASCYVVSEWGEGLSLDNLLAAEHSLSPRRAAWLVGEVGNTLATAHAAGIRHGRVIPENVMIDRTGSVRLIGLAIDAAMHGVRPNGPEGDVRDLAALLYAALTGTWPEATGAPSSVPSAHAEADRWLRPRQVRAGIPRVLDDICDAVLNGAPSRSTSDLTTARGITDALQDFVGDPTGLAAAEAAKVSQIRHLRMSARLADQDPQRPAPPDALTDSSADALGRPDSPTAAPARVADPPPEPTPEPDPEPEPEQPTMPVPVVRKLADPPRTDTNERAVPALDGEQTVALPPPDAGERTQAGLPIFDDESGESRWLTTESRGRPTPGPPPPPPEPPPAKPLFAPDPPEGEPVRRPRREAVEQSGEFWPWEEPPSAGLPAVEEPEQPPAKSRAGRRLLQIAGTLAALALLLVAVAFAFKLGRGDSPSDQPSDSDNASPTAAPTELSDLSATDLDPQGDPPEEYPELAANVVDGDPATTWHTQTYTDQFGPGGLKTGVGVVVDLGASYDVRKVEVQYVGAPTAFAVYVGGDEPGDPSGQPPAARQRPTATGTGAQTSTLTLKKPAKGRYLTIWLTALPPADGGYRGEIAEVVVSA